MVVIIDYGIGNTRSVSKAVEHLGVKAILSCDAGKIKKASTIILPGVSGFGATIHELKTRGILDIVKEHVAKGKKYLGICLGMQILMERSQESEGESGLAVFRGVVKKLPCRQSLIVPHMGWDNVVYNEKNSLSEKLFRGIAEGSFFYFAHSYYVVPKDKQIAAGLCVYGVKYPAVIARDNIVACQFHPEKSQDSGLRFLRNFLDI